MADVSISGFAAPEFGAVVEEFERNFAERDEVGAAFAAVVGGELVVDLWGGWGGRTGRTVRGRSDTLQVMFSGTKGLVAVCVLLCLERGLLDLDEGVTSYWPEFGKDEIRVRDVVSHRARLPGIEEPVSFDEVTDSARMATLLEAQEPHTDPRAAFCYHAMTFGWLCGELVRRVDGRSIGRFFAEEVAGPLGLEVWIGLPSSLEERVSRIELATRLAGDRSFRRADVLARPAPPRDLGQPADVRARDVRVERPGVPRCGDPRHRRNRYRTRRRAPVRQPRPLARSGDARARHDDARRRMDDAHGTQSRFGVGFELQTDERGLGPTEDAFGHGGAGGSIHGAWPSRALGLLLRHEPNAGRRACRPARGGAARRPRPRYSE